jgi:hypothetical protein
LPTSSPCYRKWPTKHLSVITLQPGCSVDDRVGAIGRAVYRGAARSEVRPTAGGVDVASGLVHTVTGTAANEADINQAASLLHGQEEASSPVLPTPEWTSDPNLRTAMSTGTSRSSAASSGTAQRPAGLGRGNPEGLVAGAVSWTRKTRQSVKV